MKTIIERGASWTLEETKLLLALWGQDLVQRQATNTKRTKEVYEKISEKFNQNGFERTADQVRTRVFNMIAEYRRILKDPSPERMKKCIFFEALHKIYQAKHMDDVKSALDDYEPEYPYSPATISSEKGDESVSDSETTDINETLNSTPAATNTNNINTTTTNNDNNNGDSNSNSNIEKESSSANTHSSSHGGSKRIKLESPKSSHNQTNQAQSAAASTSSTNSSSDHQANAKQSKSSTAPPVAAITISGSTIPPAAAASSSSSSSQRHQSLLLPHATTSSSSTTSTPTSKITTSGSNNTPSYININSTKLPIIRTNQLIGHSNGTEAINVNGTTTRLPTTAAITSHQLYQAPVNTFDVTSSALLIDRMFAHLSRESENMREWIALEKERLALEKTRRQQETEREVRRERILIDTLMRFQDQWLSFLSRLDPRIVDNASESLPELKIHTSASLTEATQTLTNTQNSSTYSSNTTSTDASKQ